MFRENRFIFRDVEKLKTEAVESLAERFGNREIIPGIKFAEVAKDNPLLEHLEKFKGKLDSIKDVKIFAHRPGEIEFGTKVIDSEEVDAYVAGTETVGRGTELGEAYDAADRGPNVGDVEEVDVMRLVKDPNRFTIDGLAYAALVWPRIGADVKTSLRGTGLNDAEIEAALSDVKEGSAIEELVMRFARNLNSKGDKESKQIAIEELANKAKEQIGVDRKLTKFGTTSKLDGLKKFNDLSEAELGTYIRPHDSKIDKLTQLHLNKNVEQWALAMNLRESAVNPTIWDYSSAKGLARIRFDAANGLKLAIDDSPWKEMFNELSKASTDSYPKDAQLQAAFLDPEKPEHKSLLEKEEPSFLLAYEKFKIWKEELAKMNLRQAKAAELASKRGEVPGLSTVMDGVKEQWNLMAKSVRDRDWATMALYAAGIWGTYKLFKDSKDTSVMGFVKKMLPYVGVAALGLKVAGDNGFDVLEKIGLTNMFADVEGTSLEVLMKMDGLAAQGKVSADTMLSVSRVSMKELWMARQGSHTVSAAEAPGFINPLELAPGVYNETFGSLAGNLAERRKNNKQYDRVGTELFALSGMVEEAYNKTMGKVGSGSKYAGVPFHEVMQGELGSSSIIDFAEELKKYVNYKVDDKGEKEMSKRLTAVLGGRNLGLGSLNRAKVGTEEVIVSSVAGLPIVVTETGDGYKIFDRAAYEADLANATALLVVPRDEEVGDTALAQFDERVKAKAQAKIEAALPGAKGKLKWSGDSWSYEKSGDPRLSNFGITAKNVEVKVLILPNGKVEEVEETGLENGEILKKLAADIKSPTLDLFRRNKAAKFVEFKQAGSDWLAVLEIAGKKFEVGLDASSKLAIKAGEKELVESKEFRAKYLELIKSDSSVEFKASLDNIMKKLEATDEESIEHVSKTITGQAGDKEQSIGEELGEGSINEPKVKQLIELLKYQVYLKLDKALGGGSGTIADFEKNAGDYLAEVEKKLSMVTNRLNSRDPNDNMAQNEFRNDVLDPMIESACVSPSYGHKMKEAYEAFYVANKGWNSRDHEKIRSLMEKYLSFTAEVDTNAFGRKEEDYCDFIREAIKEGKTLVSFREFSSAMVTPHASLAPMAGPELESYAKGYLNDQERFFAGRFTLKDEPVKALRENFLNKRLSDLLAATAGKTRSNQQIEIEAEIKEYFSKHIEENTHGFYREAAGAEHIGDGLSKLWGGLGSAVDYAKKLGEDWGNNLPDEDLSYPLSRTSLRDYLKVISTARKEGGKFIYTNSEGKNENAVLLSRYLKVVSDVWKVETEKVESDCLKLAWSNPEAVDDPSKNVEYKELHEMAQEYRLQYAIAAHLLETHKECFDDEKKVDDEDKLKSLIDYYRNKLITD